jgi:TetR/AcrR family transcriptional regulator
MGRWDKQTMIASKTVSAQLNQLEKSELIESESHMVKPFDKTLQLNNDSTEQRILRAARSEFVDQGLSGARMQAIADRAHVNKALLHYYFRTKEKLYDAVLQNILETVWGVLRERFSHDAPVDDVRSILRQIVTVYIKTLQENQDFPRILLREIAEGGKRLPALIESFMSSFGDIPVKINRLLQREIKRKTIRPVEPVHLAINVLGMSVFTFIAQPIFSIVNERAAMKIALNEKFYKDRIESIVTMACDGIFKEKLR